MKYQDKAQFEKANVFGKGNPNTAYAQYFKGNSFLNLLLKPGEPFVVAMLLLNLVAETTGTFTMLQMVVARS